MLLRFILIVVLISSTLAKIEYPNVRRDESVVNEFYGVKVSDPYRWLEDSNSEEVKEFVDAQNKVTANFLDIPIRDQIHQTLTKAFDYPRYKTPERHGSRYFFYENSGTQNQDVLYVQDSLTSEPRVFFDPNTLSEDGTVSVYYFSFSEDGELVTYGLNSKGSDWVTVRVRNVSTGVDFNEVLNQIKFTTFEWTHDNKGFFYGRYPEHEGKSRADGTETERVMNQKIYYHRVGTNQTEDVLVVEFPDHPTWLIGGLTVTREGRYLIIYPSAGASGQNLIYYADLQQPLRSGFNSNLTVTPVVSKFEAEYTYVTNDDSVVYFLTNKDAPHYQIVSIDLLQSNTSSWSTVIPEEKGILQWAFPVNQDKLVVGYLNNVQSKLELRYLNGTFIQNFPIEIGTVNAYSGKRSQNEFFFNFVSFLSPGTVFHVDFTKEPLTANLFKEVKAPGFDASKFITKQVFYPSKDGTQVPMFITHKKDYVPQRDSPTYIYAYGGFNINILPSFNPERVAFVQHFDGVFAIPNIRGGGEFGREWHDGGKLLNKQNSFDDFQAAAEYLVAQNYTVPSKIVINGGSNGGLLIGACINQRPELYGGGIAQVGVHDLLRFQKFTIGYAWCSEYGCSDDGNQTHFENLYRLSPLHNVRLPQDETVQYPSVLLMTGDHDDRVVPLHSYKLASELQHTIGRSSRQTNPLLLKVTTSAGHGAGKPTKVKISEFADIFSFLVKGLGYKFNP